MGDGAGPCSFCSLLEKSTSQAAAGGAGTRRSWGWVGWVIPTDGVRRQQREPASPGLGRGGLDPPCKQGSSQPAAAPAPRLLFLTKDKRHPLGVGLCRPCTAPCPNISLALPELLQAHMASAFPLCTALHPPHLYSSHTHCSHAHRSRLDAHKQPVHTQPSCCWQTHTQCRHTWCTLTTVAHSLLVHTYFCCCLTRSIHCAHLVQTPSWSCLNPGAHSPLAHTLSWCTVTQCHQLTPPTCCTLTPGTAWPHRCFRTWCAPNAPLLPAHTAPLPSSHLTMPYMTRTLPSSPTTHTTE